MKRWFLILLAALILVPTTARADISFLLHESIGAAGEFTGSGHAAIYLSNICTDDGISLRLCGETESGVVISSYRNFGNGSTYEWMAVPLVPFLYGVDDQSEIPIYANGKIRNFLREKYRQKHLNAIIPAPKDGTMPAGSWQVMLTTVFNRDIYGFTVKTTAEEDAQFLLGLNSKPNNGTFHTFTSNCADFAGSVINKYFPGAARRDWINDAGITTPKAIARSFFNYAKARPEMGLSISRFPQIPGPLVRSSDNRNLTEMAYTSKKYLIPSILFKPELIAIFSATYLLTGRFNVHKTYVKYANAEIARLEREKRTASTTGLMYFAEKPGSKAIDGKPKRAGDGLLGNKETWKAHKSSFAPILKDLIAQGLFRDEKEVKTFFRDLELQSEPATDQDGRLILKVKYYGQDRIVGITRLNLIDHNSDPELALKLTIARIYTDLNADEKNRNLYPEFWADWLTMRQLIREQALTLGGIDKARGPFAMDGHPSYLKQKLVKLAIDVTH
jgi:hypothetical protein